MALVAQDQLERYRGFVADRLRSFSSEFTVGQKAGVIAAAAVVVALGVIYMTISGRPTYSPLFTNLSASDAASITSKLSADKIPYKLSPTGTEVMVPANDVASARISMAEAGLPTQSNVGLSQVNQAGITTSQLAQQTDYLIGLQGELETTIDAISGVQSSQVNVALPANQTFVLNGSNPTGASVLVDLAPGATLSPDEVQAIVHLVASSVPGLTAGDVTVADSNGNLLAGPGVTAAIGTETAATQSYDKAVEAKVEGYLTTVLGPNNADVVVNAALDFNKTSTTTNQVLPNPASKTNPNSYCTSTSTNSQTFTGSGSLAGGALGSVTPTGGTGPTNYKNTSTQQNCTAGSSTTTNDIAPGQLTNQSVAVLVNSKALPAGVNLATLQTGVTNAAHIQTARGDTLSFASMPFSATAATSAAKAAAAAAAATKQASLMNELKDAVLALVILLVLFLLWRSARKARREEIESQVEIPELLGYPGAALAGEPTTQIPAVAPGMEPLTAVDIGQFVDSQPDEVAATLRSWMRESGSKVASGAGSSPGAGR